METMLVTQALNELKLLNDRIENKIYSCEFVESAKKSDKNVSKGMTKEKFITNAKSDYDSVMDLIKRRQKIKNAIVASNAVEKVIVAGIEMTRAEAIEMKSSIQCQKELLAVMETQYASAVKKMENANQKVDNTIDDMLAKLYGRDSDKKLSKDDQDAVATPYREANQYALVDALNIKEKIDDLREFIGRFTSEVDSVLQVSNCTTTIEF